MYTKNKIEKNTFAQDDGLHATETILLLKQYITKIKRQAAAELRNIVSFLCCVCDRCYAVIHSMFFYASL